WLHNGFVNVNGQKMSKSLGNFTTLRQALALYHPMALRLFLLQTHYRSPIDLTEAAMEAASHGWETLQKGIHCAQQFGQGGSPDSEAMRAFQTAMDDDFGTPGALALAFELAKELIREHNLLTHQGHTHLQPHLLRQKGAALLEILATLGFCWPQPAQGSEKAAANGELAKLPPLEDARIEELVAQRTAARKAKNFAEADRIREQLKALGITLIDQKDGTTRWLRQ
ncbi:class I tRNA ligase family protein, partial [Synechococcus sp. WC101]